MRPVQQLTMCLTIAKRGVNGEILGEAFIGVEADLMMALPLGFTLREQHELPPKPEALAPWIDRYVLDEHVCGSGNELEYGNQYLVSLQHPKLVVGKRTTVIGEHWLRLATNALNVLSVRS